MRKVEKDKLFRQQPIIPNKIDKEKIWSQVPNGEDVKKISESLAELLQRENPFGEIHTTIRLTRLYMEEKLKELEIPMTLDEFIVWLYRESDEFERKMMFIHLKIIKGFMASFPRPHYYEHIMRLKYYKNVKYVNEISILLRFEQYYYIWNQLHVWKIIFPSVMEDMLKAFQAYSDSDNGLRDKVEKLYFNTAINKLLPKQQQEEVKEGFFQVLKQQKDILGEMFQLFQMNADDIDILNRQIANFDIQAYCNQVFDGILDDIELEKESKGYRHLLLHDLFVPTHRLSPRKEIQKIYRDEAKNDVAIQNIDEFIHKDWWYITHFEMPVYMNEIRKQIIREVDKIIPS